ncbi:hypothetical protein KA005_04660 [bacterium]|nr:hypothetical protein [bacterium]
MIDFQSLVWIAAGILSGAICSYVLTLVYLPYRVNRTVARLTVAKTSLIVLVSSIILFTIDHIIQFSFFIFVAAFLCTLLPFAIIVFFRPKRLLRTDFVESRWDIPIDSVLEKAVRNSGVEYEFEPVQSMYSHFLKDRYILWVDDAGLMGTEGIEKEFQKVGVSLVVVLSTEAAAQKIKEKKPDVIISDIARGNDYDAGLEMAEEFIRSGLYQGRIYFYAGDIGHGRIRRASRIGAMIFTEPEPLIREVKEYLSLHHSK